MVLVICPNLAVDYTLRVEKLEPGAVHRTAEYERQAGGKGANTARTLIALGEKPVLCGFAGGPSGRFIEQDLAREGIATELVPMRAENRTCVVVIDQQGNATVLNEVGPTIHEAAALRALAGSMIPKSQAVALMGSLPPGVPPDLYGELIRDCRQANIPCLVDATGPALESALSTRPTYAKVNGDEAEALLGHPVEDWPAAARTILKLGADVVLITRGARAAFLASADGAARLSPPSIPVVNPIGAGDALAGGLLVGHLRGLSLPESAKLGMAVAAASVQHGFGRVQAADIRPDRIELASV